MTKRIEQKNSIEKRGVYNNKLILFSFFFSFISLHSFCQDSIPLAKDSLEEENLKFQQFFFKALSEKSIGNYQKAIENLESCHQISINDATVFFEFSKNYFELNKMLLAKEYINRGLLKEPKNIWMLKHLVQILLKEKNTTEAIIVQQKLVDIDLKERAFLLNIYLQNKDFKSAISLMNLMEQDNLLTSKYKKLKNKLETTKTSVVVKKESTVDSLKDEFKTNKSYAILKQILEAYSEKPEMLLQYSTEGISLFPAQPFVYLMKGKALNYMKKHKKALLFLSNGLDFVIDDPIELYFYKEMALSHRGLGNRKEEEKFIEKAKINKG
jgi:predicted Zn-dependent protease